MSQVRRSATIALLLFAGCTEEEVDTGPTTVVIQEDPWTGLGKWLLTIVESTTTETVTCEENWIDGTCNDDPTQDGALVSTQTSDSTPPGSSITLVQDEGAVVWLATNNRRLYPGSQEGNTFTFTWDGEENSELSIQSAMSLPVGERYTWSRNIDGTSQTTISLEVDLTEGTATGTATYTESAVRAWTESDEWSYADNDYQNDRIDNYSSSYLYGNWNNGTYDDDCQGNTCALTITANRTIEYTLAAQFLSDSQRLQDVSDFFSTSTHGTPSGLGGPPF